MLEDSIERVIVYRDTIKARVKELADEISMDYRDKDLLLICVLKGGVVFLSDLMREIDMTVDVDFMLVSSYGSGTKSSGKVKILKDLDESIEGRHVLIVEDLIDTGLTLKHLKDLLFTRDPASVSVCTIFDKPARRLVDMELEYVGIEIPDEFVVGYGLDYAGKYRNLQDLCTLKPGFYTQKP